CGDATGGVTIWDITAKENDITKPIHTFQSGVYIRSMAYFDNPRCLLTHGKDSIVVFDLETEKVQPKVDLSDEIRCWAADPATNRLIVGFQSGALTSFSLPGLSPGPRIEKAHSGSVDFLAVSPDGRLLASGGTDHHAILRDATTLEPLLDFPPRAEELRGLTFD